LKVYLPPRSLPGLKVTSVLPTRPPWTSAPESWAAAFKAERCWGLRPGLEREARMRVMWMGTPSMAL